MCTGEALMLTACGGCEQAEESDDEDTEKMVRDDFDYEGSKGSTGKQEVIIKKLQRCE